MYVRLLVTWVPAVRPAGFDRGLYYAGKYALRIILACVDSVPCRIGVYSIRSVPGISTAQNGGARCYRHALAWRRHTRCAWVFPYPIRLFRPNIPVSVRLHHLGKRLADQPPRCGLPPSAGSAMRRPRADRSVRPSDPLYPHRHGLITQPNGPCAARLHRGRLNAVIHKDGHFYFVSLRKHKNQSRQYCSSFWFSIRSRAVPHEPAVGTITSSPGRQSAGVAH